MLDEIPNDAILQELELFSILLAKEAGEILSEYRPGKTKVKFKGEQETDPVTMADLKIEEHIGNKIRLKYPDHSIIGEEGANEIHTIKDFTWVIDPLDGTANFASGFMLHGVSIGLVYKGTPILGSIYIPSDGYAGTIFHARTGGGAFSDSQRLDISHLTETKPSGLTGLPYMAHRKFDFNHLGNMSIGEIRITGSIVYEMILISKGILQLSIFNRPHIWDIAAGVVLIKESGGEVMQWQGKSWAPLIKLVDPSSPESSLDPINPIMIGSRQIVRDLSSRIVVKLSLMKRLAYAIKSIWTYG